MLALMRREEEGFSIYAPGVGKIRVFVIHLQRGQVHLGIDAPPAVAIVRDELIGSLKPQDHIHIRIPRSHEPLTFCGKNTALEPMRAVSYQEIEMFHNDVVCLSCRTGLDSFMDREQYGDSQHAEVRDDG